MALSDIADDREQWRELVALAAMAGSSWMMGLGVIVLELSMHSLDFDCRQRCPECLCPVFVSDPSLHLSRYLSMDNTRKLLLVLESDPKVHSLPLIGV